LAEVLAIPKMPGLLGLALSGAGRVGALATAGFAQDASDPIVRAAERKKAKRCAGIQ
jgi:hypothetical protein